MDLHSLTLKEILELLPHKLQVRFALNCANDVRHLLTDERSIKALDITALWLEDKATYEEVRTSDIKASYAADHAINPAASSATSAAARAAATAAAYAASSIFNATVYAVTTAADYTSRVTNKDYKLELIKMIENLSKLEKALYLGE